MIEVKWTGQKCPFGGSLGECLTLVDMISEIRQPLKVTGLLQITCILPLCYYVLLFYQFLFVWDFFFNSFF